MKPCETHIIAQVNHKGGSGKTTTTLNLAAALAELGLSVCCVDIDEQCNLTTGFGVDTNAHQRDGKFTALDIFLKKREAIDIVVPIVDDKTKEPRFEGRVRLIPGHRQLNSTESHLRNECDARRLQNNASELDADELKDEQRHRLKKSLETLRGTFDIVLIDTHPDLGYLTTAALLSADWLIVPVFPSGYDLDGLHKLQSIRRKVAGRYNPRLNFLGVLLGRFDATARLDHQIYQTLFDLFPGKLFKTKVGASVRHREAPLYGKSIIEHAPDHQSSENFRELAREVVSRLVEAERQQSETSAEGTMRVPNRLQTPSVAEMPGAIPEAIKVNQ